MVTVGTMYFYTILHDLMCVNFGHNWLKYDTFKKKNYISITASALRLHCLINHTTHT